MSNAMPQTQVDQMANFMARRWPELHGAPPAAFHDKIDALTPSLIAKEFELNEEANYASWPPAHQTIDYFVMLVEELRRQPMP